MIEGCINALTDWLTESGAIGDKEKELYSYATLSAILMVFPLVLASIIGLFFGYIKYSIIVVLPFMLLRKFSGGFHAKHLWICLLSSSILLFSCIWVAKNLDYSIELAVITCCAVVSLCVHSPIENENKRLEEGERRYYRKITIFFAGVFLILSFLCEYVGWSRCAVCLSIGISLSAGLQLPCIVRRRASD